MRVVGQGEEGQPKSYHAGPWQRLGFNLISWEAAEGLGWEISTSPQFRLSFMGHSICFHTVSTYANLSMGSTSRYFLALPQTPPKTLLHYLLSDLPCLEKLPVVLTTSLEHMFTLQYSSLFLKLDLPSHLLCGVSRASLRLLTRLLQGPGTCTLLLIASTGPM